MRSGQTVVIGGLMEDRKTETINKVPLLGDIPLIGNAFKRTERSKSKTELLIFLTPHVTSDPDALGGMSAEELQGATLTPNAVSPGTFDGHMEGLQRGGNAPSTAPDPGITPVPAPASDKAQPQPEPTQELTPKGEEVTP